MAARDAPPILERERSHKRAKAPGALEQYAEAAADALVRFWQGGDAVAVLKGVLDREQVVWHDSLPERAVVGLSRLQALGTLLRTAVPDLVLTLQRPLHGGQDGVVLGYWSATGSHSGPLGPSLPPSGARVSWEGSVVIRSTPMQQHAHRQQEGEAQQQQAQAVAGPNAQEQAQPSEEQRGQDRPRGEVPEQQQGDAEAGLAEPGLRGVEVWWSWDPIFLFRQMGWQQQQLSGQRTVAAGTEAGEGERGAVGDTAATTADPATDDPAARTAAVAREAFATEEQAAEAAAAAVAAAADAASKLAESGEALSAMQAANRAVVELYFHTYNTGHYRVLDHIVHPRYHYDGLLDLGARRGREAMKAMMGGWRNCLPDLAIGHELFAAVGSDKVLFRWVIQGSHATPDSTLLGVPAPPPGSPVPRLLVRGVTTLTLREGRISRKVSHANAAHTLSQLGAAVHPIIPL